METLPEVMRRRMNEEGLTFRALDKATDITATQLERIANGQATNPTLETLSAIARVLGPEIIVAAYAEVASLSVARKKRVTARKLSQPERPMLEQTYAVG